MNLYRYIPVWRRSPNGATLYRCFEILGQGFTVQSRYYYRPQDIQDPKQALSHNAQFLELFMEEAPEARSHIYPTIEEAIEKFDDGFET